MVAQVVSHLEQCSNTINIRSIKLGSGAETPHPYTISDRSPKSCCACSKHVHTRLGDALVCLQHAGATTEASGRTRKRLKRKLLPEKVLWRFSNQNMPRVFDLDSRQTCSVHHTEARPSATPPGDQLHSPCFTREGLAVIRECSDWWNKLVCLLS